MERALARVKLTLPDAWQFDTTVTVRIGDINYGGHLGNDAVLSLVHEARLQYFKSLGYSEIDIEGVGIVLADAVVVVPRRGLSWRRPARARGPGRLQRLRL